MGYLSCRADSSVATCRSVAGVTVSGDHHHRPQILLFSYQELALATSNFSERSLLGRGSHGSVYKALIPSIPLPVAVKRSSVDASNEISILSALRSPRLVNLLGFSDNRRLLVVEYMPNGTLYDLLHCTTRPPSWHRRLRLALHTAKALLALHSARPPVVHRDVKAANVLIDHRFNARLADFGLAVRVEHGDGKKVRSLTPPAGTLGYLDPSYVTPESLSTKTDVFSFGILLLEIMSGRKAIDVAHSPPSVVDWAVPLLRSGRVSALFDPRIAPPRDAKVRRELAWLAASCVRSCKEKRPTMGEVVERLKVLSKMVSSRGWNGLIVGNPCSVVDTENSVEKDNSVSKLNLGSVVLDQSWVSQLDEEEDRNSADEEVPFCEKKLPLIIKASQSSKGTRKVFDNESTWRSRSLNQTNAQLIKELSADANASKVSNSADEEVPFCEKKPPMIVKASQSSKGIRKVFDNGSTWRSRSLNQTNAQLIKELSADAIASKVSMISRARTIHVSRESGVRDASMQLSRTNTARSVSVKTFPRFKELKNIDVKALARAEDLT